MIQDNSIYDSCANIASQALLTLLTRDPLRGLSTATNRKTFVTTIRAQMRQRGLIGEVEVSLKGGAITFTLPGHIVQMDTDYIIVLGADLLAELIDLGNRGKPRVNR